MQYEVIRVTVQDPLPPALTGQFRPLFLANVAKETLVEFHNATGIAAAIGDTVVIEIDHELFDFRVMDRELSLVDQQLRCHFTLQMEGRHL